MAGSWIGSLCGLTPLRNEVLTVKCLVGLKVRKLFFFLCGQVPFRQKNDFMTVKGQGLNFFINDNMII